MKITIVMILLALGMIGCKTSQENAGAPPPGYETDTGQRPIMTPEPVQPGSWQRYRFQGITPTTPP